MESVMQNIGIIGGADGPTAILIVSQFPWLFVGIGAAVIAAVILLALYLKHK